MLRVVRAGRSFRVVLDRDDWKRAMTHAFHAAVIKVYMRDFDFWRQSVCLDRESVIVRSDLNVAVAKILYWLIATAMTEDEFESLAAKRAPKQLMAKADTERGHT